MIGMWYIEAGKYNVLPIDSRGVQRFAEERPQIAANRKQYTLLSRHTIDPACRGAEDWSTGPTALQCKPRCRRMAPRASCSAWAATTAASRSMSRTVSSAYVYNYVALDYYYVKSPDAIPAGRHFLSMEFEPTGKPDVKNGKGAPGVVKLLVDGKEVGHGDFR